MVVKISEAKPLNLKHEWRSVESLLLRFVPKAWGVVLPGLKIDFEEKKGDERLLPLAELSREGRMG